MKTTQPTNACISPKPITFYPESIEQALKLEEFTNRLAGQGVTKARTKVMRAAVNCLIEQEDDLEELCAIGSPV